ncbi:hypothetical protein Rhopal_000843-T1 [Rhodotorula paludigena]|uniref:Proteophosphoglycan ppg4 n=1 Tax=Rhodotorula paludigena TaxID=86838 RepID=A0AAV5GC74_9BASI|nr:hypothetical protein Rhopal_000843-T1 [Rhodotorula paludigena]
MGVPSPTAYDALLLEKVKLLLQAAMHNPKRRGPQLEFEDFVVGLDTNDESSRRAFEVLLYETATRRPRKVRRVEASSSTHAAGESTSTATRRRRALSPDPLGLSSGSRLSRFARPNIFSDSESETDESDDSARTALTPAWAFAGDAQHGAAADEDVSPAMQLRRRELADLFGTDEGPAPFSRVLSGLPSTSAVGEPTFEELWNILLEEPFPSDTITSFPSFLSALNASSFSTTTLNCTDMRGLLSLLSDRDPAFSIRLTNALRNRSRSPHRVMMTASGPPTSSSLLSLRGWGGRHASREDEGEGEGEGEGGDTGTDVSPLREGIWRASFIEHLNDGTPRETDVSFGDDGLPSAGDGSAGAELHAAQASTFSEFARRVRNDRRRRLVQPADEQGEPGASPVGMDVDSPAATAAGESTPAITVTDASTPATSAGQSPPATTSLSADGCLPSTSGPRRHQHPTPRSSASIAEAAFRAQRPIARLRSTSPHLAPSTDSGVVTTGERSDASLGAVVEALNRARERRGGFEVRVRSAETSRRAVEAGARARNGDGDESNGMRVPEGTL